MISIVVHLGGGVSNTKDDREQAVAIQNLLICVEMLIFSLAHWCVFPYEEWEPGYRPKQMARPGLGIRDFAKDVRVIMGRGQQGAVPIPQTPTDEVVIEMHTEIMAEETENDNNSNNKIV